MIRVPLFARLSATAVVAALLTGVVAAQSAPGDCSSLSFRGFDSRLDVELVARVDLGGSQVTGFEVAGGRPVIAFERRLLGIDNGRLMSMPSLERIDGLAADANGRLWVQHGTRVRRVGKERVEAAGELAPDRRLHNSGHALFMQSAALDGRTRLVVHGLTEEAVLPPVDLEGGKLVTLSWSQAGMAAVVGGSLVAWPAGARSVTRLLEDEGLRAARDVALVAPGRSVVALPDTLALVTDRGIAVLALIRARVRWSDNALFVLDESWGAVWKVSGLDRLGTVDGDKAHASAILKQLPPGAPETHLGFLQAARIVGCEGARKLAKRR